MKQHLTLPMTVVGISLALSGLLQWKAGPRGGPPKTTASQACAEFTASQEISPPPVAAERNFFNAPGMVNWFSRRVSDTNPAPLFALNGAEIEFSLARLQALPVQAGDRQVSLERLRQEFAQLEPQRQLLWAACLRPQTRLETDLRDPLAMDLPNYVNLRRVAQTLVTHHGLSLLDHQPVAALQDLYMLRRLADVAGSVPLAVGVMVRLSILELYLNSAQSAAEAGWLTAVDMRTISMQIGNLNLVETLADCLRAERALLAQLAVLPVSKLNALLAAVSAKERQKTLALLDRAQQQALAHLDVPARRMDFLAFLEVFDAMEAELSRSPARARLAEALLPNYRVLAARLNHTQTRLQRLHDDCFHAVMAARRALQPVTSPYETGGAEARRDLLVGVLALKRYGLLSFSGYEQTRESKYGIQIEYVGGCMVDHATVANAAGYNAVMTAEIERRYGKGVLE